MKRHQLLNSSIFLFLFSCIDNTQYLESRKNHEAGFVVKNYPDSILINYRKYKDLTFNSGSKLVKRGDELWAIHQPENENSQYVNFSDKKFQDYVFLSWKEHKVHLVDELDLVDDSVLVYRIDKKYLTEVKSNRSPVKRFYYYDRDYRIDSVIWIIANDTIVYK